MRITVALLLSSVCASDLLAQTAAVAVSHNDPDGVVSPGETVRITAWHSRSGESILARIEGDLRATGDAGLATSFSSQLLVSPPQMFYSNAVGTPAGGSVLGVSHAFLSHPIFLAGFFPEPQFGIWTGVEVLSYDWTAPSVSTPTTINFDWTPSAAYPDVYAIIPPYGGLHWAFLPTTYTGTSLLVLPAPASLTVLAALALTPRRRR